LSVAADRDYRLLRVAVTEGLIFWAGRGDTKRL